jgi:hypothetical protein
MGDAISASQRLSATLRFLTTGQSFEDLKFLTAIAPKTLGSIIIEMCQETITVLKNNIKVILLIHFYSLQFNITQADKCRLKLFVGYMFNYICHNLRVWKKGSTVVLVGL